MIRRKSLLFFLTVVLLLCLPGCGSEAEENGTLSGGDEVLLTEEISDPGDFYSLGSARMTPAEGKSASVDYSPLGGEVFLELEDASGTQWRLEIPENALPYGERITMQLCESVEPDFVSGKQAGGVILQPEGLQFILPATLTVSGPAVQKESCLFSGKGTGQELNFTDSEADDKNLRFDVSHFSAYIVYTPTGSSEIQEAQDLAATAYKELLAEVKEFLKTPVAAPPVPSDYTFECEDGENGTSAAAKKRELDDYIQRAMEPELALVERLLGAGGHIANLGGETDSRYYIGLLLNRNLKKADKLFVTYQSDNDKLIPVMNFTFKVLKEMDAQGIETPSGYMDGFSDWMERAAEEQLKKIKEEHDYKALGPAMALVKGGAVMSSDFSASSEFTRKYMEKLKKAMTFEVKYEISVYSAIAEQKMTLEGKTKVVFLDKDDENPYRGKGKGEYLSYTHSGPGVTKLELPNQYTVENRFVDFYPCESQNVKVWVSTIGAETEVWYNPVLDERSSDEYSFVNFLAENLFAEYAAESGGYIFEVPFQNKNAIMGKESFTKTNTISYPEEGSASGSITYSIEIKHTPK